MKRKAIWILLAVIALLSGIWIGEDPGSFLISNTGLLAIGALVVIAGFSQKGMLRRFLACVITIAVFSTGHFIGKSESRKAYGDCVSNGEAVRNALENHRSKTGRYPDRLDQLGTELPGDLFLRDSILQYHRTENGYQIEFSDWLVSHRATERSPFHPTK